MLEFPATNGIQIYASDNGFICFKSTGDLFYQEEEQIVCLSIGQLRAVIKNADKLIAEAEQNKSTYRGSSND
jgi:hypothetical protein